MNTIKNLSDFDKIYPKGLTKQQNKVLPLFLEGKTDQEIAAEIDVYDRSTVTYHIQKISLAFGISSKEKSDYRCMLIDLFIKYRRDLVGEKALKKCGLKSKPKIPFPEISEPLNSPFYIPRKSDSESHEEVKQPGALIRIKAPKQMGKTSLIKRIIEEAKKKHNYYTTYLDFSILEKSIFHNTCDFFRGFYSYISDQLPESPPLKNWDKDMPIVLSITRQFQTLLQNLDGVLVLALDEIDKLFEYPDISETFFAMLRHWHEKRNDLEIWQKIRLVITHSTEDYGRLDLNKSPFNVGIPIRLEEFDKEQIIKLAHLHRLDHKVVSPVMSLVGGHPYLVRLAFYYLVHQEQSRDELIKDASTEAGIYNDHLRRHLETLEQNENLGSVLKKIVTNSEPVYFEQQTKQIFQLDSMGLIKQDGNLVKPRCQLYHLYFRERLK